MIIPPGGERNSDLLEDEIWPQTPLSLVTTHGLFTGASPA